MGSRINPTAIGLFIVGAIALAMYGVATLASNTFRVREQFTSSFNESVNGLDVGAVVKCQGVPIGQVVDLQLRIDLDEETFQVPVLYEIDLERLVTVVGPGVDWADPDVLQRHIEQGLRAQLQMESFVTGKLYIELSYMANPPPLGPDRPRHGHLEIPTVLSPLAELGEEATGLVAGLRSFDVSTINQNLVTLLVKANQKLAELDVAAINASFVRSAGAVEELARAPELRQSIEALPELAERLGRGLEEAERLLQHIDTSVEPLAAQLEDTGKELALALASFREALDSSKAALSTDTGLGYQMQQAMTSMTEAAEALQTLARALERNPGMLVRGKQPPDQTP
ncbi:MAG: MlaD family protein [Rhodothermales bacterium]